MILEILTSLSFLGPDTQALSRGTIIPTYFRPYSKNGTDEWTALKQAQSDYPIEVWTISGYYTEEYPELGEEFDKLGIKTLGYVDTGEFSKRPPLETVYAKVKELNETGNVNGIFYDNVIPVSYMTTKEYLDYYKKAVAYAKTFGYTVVGNANSKDKWQSVIPELFDYSGFDMLNVFELTGYFPSIQTLCDETYLKYADRMAIIAYKIPELNSTFIENAKECIGYFWITNNYTDSFPSYISQEFEILKD